MKRLVSIVLALAMLLALTACGTTDSDVHEDGSGSVIDREPDASLPVERPDTQSVVGMDDEIPGRTGADSDNVDARLMVTLPAGWRYGPYRGDDGFGWAFAPEGGDFELILRYSYQLFGICGTGVTSEEFTTDAGISGICFSEENVAGPWRCYYFDPENKPGSYYMEATYPSAYDEEVRQIVQSVVVGRFELDGMIEETETDVLSDEDGNNWSVRWGSMADPKTERVTLLASGVKSDTTSAQAATATGDFAVNLLRNCWDGQESALVSPYSVLSALGMVANGARGETLVQMEQVLGVDVNTLNDYVRELMRLQDGDDSLSLANAIWLNTDSTLELDDDFQSAVQGIYRSQVNQQVFGNQTVDEINEWVKERTRERITRLFETLPEDSALVLVNALAFDGAWVEPYEEWQVQKETFHALDGTRQTVDMMRGSEEVYLVDDRATGFLKPYEGGSYAFVAMLPNEGVTLEEYVDGLTGEKLQKLLSSAQYTKVITGLPKFELSYGATLNEVLQQMGMTDAFDASVADLTGIGDSRNPLYISSVVHKTYICVDENGTKAAAATGVVAGEAADAVTAPPPEVILDRPFLYLIVDTITNAPVFLGVVTEIG